MYLDIFLLYTLFITLARSENSTLTLPERNKNVSNTSSSVGPKLDHSKTKLSLVSEGGTLLPNTLDISLPKQKLTSLMNLDEELGKTKEKAVVPRKGVDNFLADTVADAKVLSTLESNKTILATPDRLNTTIKNFDAVVPAPKNIHSSTSLNKTVESKKINSTEVHKKPMILSYEALANMEKNMQNNQPKVSVAPSTKTMASSQIPSPNEGSIVKVYSSKPNSHPGMIMPIVITILVVPMFAIVGYMALRRGQEAWKNRHYKRMDFLLDGMYND